MSIRLATPPIGMGFPTGNRPMAHGRMVGAMRWSWTKSVQTNMPAPLCYAVQFRMRKWWMVQFGDERDALSYIEKLRRGGVQDVSGRIQPFKPPATQSSYSRFF
jgi:hypothetical protein